MVFILMALECWYRSVCAMMVGSRWLACIWFVYVGFTCAGGWMIVAAGCKYGIDVHWFVLLMVFILMVLECWLAECIWHDGWLALVELYLICVCGSHVLAWRTAGSSSLQEISMELMFMDMCCWWCVYWWCLSVGLQSVYVMMVGSLWSACIWFVLDLFKGFKIR